MPRTLIQRMAQDQDYPWLSADTLTPSLQAVPSLLVLITGNPKDYPEANDLAVVLPELVKVFAGQFQVCVVDEQNERAFAQNYAVTQFPSLVFFKAGQYVDQIARMQDWSEYMKAIPIIVEKSPSRAPTIGIPVVAR